MSSWSVSPASLGQAPSWHKADRQCIAAEMNLTEIILVGDGKVVQNI